jgi:hypothetical protein
MRFHLARTSRNRKTGPIPVATSSSDTCPPTCPMMDSGCYAENGPLAAHWRRVGQSGLDLSRFLATIRSLPRGQLWRYGQAGDLPEAPDDVIAIARANGRRPVICYTHRRDMETYKRAGELGFTINLSADSISEADGLAESGLPVVCVLPSRYGRRDDETLAEYRTRLGGRLRLKTPGDRNVAICPATFTDTDCARCQLCARPRRHGTIIGFPAHGPRKARIDARISEKSASVLGQMPI